MSTNRREFLKISGLAAGAGITGLNDSEQSGDPGPFDPFHYRPPRQRFNMHGYAAPPLDVVRVGIIGLGNRGSGTVHRLASIEGVDIKALCDLEPERVDASIESLQGTSHDPDGYSGDEEIWKKVCERDDIDLISICTPWHLHAPMAIFAMEHDNHVYTELPAAQTIKECWKLVETSERTRKHCVQICSSAHDPHEAFVLKMVREGLFGEIIHGEGAYIHTLLNDYLFDKDAYWNNWRLKENINRNGNLYPHHGLGGVAQMMDINYGDKMEYMVSMSGNDFQMAERAEELAEKDEYWEPFTDWDYRGNMNTSIIRTKKGRTIMLQHDVTSPRPNVRFELISGTKGVYEATPERKIALSHEDWLPQEKFDALVEEHTPALTRRFNELKRQARSTEDEHGYYSTDARDWRLIDCLRNGLPVEMDVYDAALWSAIIPLSEWSVANSSRPVKVPDFTGGAWKSNERGMDIDLENGGTTRLI